MKASDAELVRRLQDDDPTALEEAFRLFSGRCNAIARNILRAHGGDIVLANRPNGGLRATATVPA